MKKAYLIIVVLAAIQGVVIAEQLETNLALNSTVSYSDEQTGNEDVQCTGVSSNNQACTTRIQGPVPSFAHYLLRFYCRQTTKTGVCRSFVSCDLAGGQAGRHIRG